MSMVDLVLKALESPGVTSRRVQEEPPRIRSTSQEALSLSSM